MVHIPSKPTGRTTSVLQRSDSEAELMACIQAQSVVFDKAVTLIERLENSASRRELGNPDSVAQLQKALEQVVSAQQMVSAAHMRCTQTNHSFTTELRNALGHHEAVLKNLVRRIDQLQKLFEGVRNELTHQLDGESRHRHMQAAYQQSLRTV